MQKSAQHILILLFMLFPCAAMSQTALTLFPKQTERVVISPDDTSVQLDFLTIPSSINVVHQDTLIGREFWSFERNTGVLELQWPDFWLPFPQEITISWQYRPLSVPRSVQLDFPLVQHSATSDREFQRTYTSGSDAYISNLSGSGSITRGVIVGSNRDLGLESGLRFDLSGYITENIRITASISDQNTFIQPDGTTQNLREFDQVFIRIQSPQADLQFGDVDASFRNSQIVRLSRRLQGAEGGYEFNESGDIRAAAAVVRGTYRVMEFPGRDGVQGPYRLTNSGNETFIIVVAGTERVYLDGILLSRGDDNDYIIDYSIGEIYFTNQRIMRNSHRIRVEYQYLSTGFTRTLTAAESDYHNLFDGRLSVGATFMREADNITFDDLTGLTETDLEVLRNAGNLTGDIFTTGVDSVGFRPDSPFLLYSRIDTLVNGRQITIYRFSPGDPNAAYRVQFSRVGTASGSYTRSTRAVNGIVYEWVGEGLGEYEPFRRLEPPQSRQALALRTELRLTPGLRIGSEWALSSRELNRYAPGNAGHDHMIVTAMHWETQALTHSTLKLWGKHEYKGRNFVFFDPVRDIEFERTWDLAGFQPSMEQRVETGIRLDRSEDRYVQWTFQYLDRDERSGFRNDVESQWNSATNTDFSLRAGQLKSEFSGISTTQWLNVNGTAGVTLTAFEINIRPFYSIDAEERTERLAEGTKREDSFRYIEHIPGLQLISLEAFSLATQYSVRTDYAVFQDKFSRSSTTYSPELDFRFRIDEYLQSRNRMAYRTRKSSDISDLQTATRGLALRSSNDVRMLNRAIEAALLYDVSTESRAVLQETYLEVGPEFGQYVWIDINGDGIPQIDEFFPEQTPNEGTYIRQLLPADELLPVVALQFRFRIQLEPFRYYPAWFTRGVRIASTFDLREQNETSKLSQVYLLQPTVFRNEELTLAGSRRLEQELQLFRHRNEINILFRHRISESLNRLAAGVESEQRNNLEFQGEYRLVSPLSLLLNVKKSYQALSNATLRSRNYDISSWGLEPGLGWSTSSGGRLGMYFSLNRSTDIFPQVDARLQAYRVRINARLPLSERLNIGMNTEFRDMQISGETTATSAFVLTEGAGEGSSWLWGGQLIWRVSSVMQATADYNGRTVAGGRSIQTARISVTATF